MFILKIYHTKPCSRPNGSFLWEKTFQEAELSAIKNRKNPEKIKKPTLHADSLILIEIKMISKSDGWLIHLRNMNFPWK